MTHGVFETGSSFGVGLRTAVGVGSLVFRGFPAGIGGAFVLAGGLGAGLPFYAV